VCVRERGREREREMGERERGGEGYRSKSRGFENLQPSRETVQLGQCLAASLAGPFASVDDALDGRLYVHDLLLHKLVRRPHGAQGLVDGDLDERVVDEVPCREDVS